MAESKNRLALLVKNTDILVAVAVIVVIVMLIIPMPTIILDLFIAINIGISLIVLLTVLYVQKAIDFSVFPTLILFATIFRIAINVSSSRLILLEGKDFDGKIIQAFGTFVVGGNYVIGLIVFLIITAVQIIVITKGATRVSEVAARFTLDAMPSKYMEITHELGQGLITEEEAKKKKAEVQGEANFYGAMDGASKFVQGDVRVGVIIIAINIIGGFIIGMVQQNLSASEAATVFLKLTVGDGLVTQIPALLVSVATGVIVTRSASKGSFADDALSEMLSNYKPLMITGGFLFLLSFLPGFPTIIMLVLAALFIGLGYYIKLNGPLISKDEREKKEKAEKEKLKEQPKDEVYNLISVEPMELEIGFNLVPLVDQAQGGDLLERIKLIRKTMASELGLIVPPIRIRDNMRLSPNEYSVKIKGIEVGHGNLRIDKYLAIPPSADAREVPGEEVIDPVFSVKARWITEENRTDAEKAGYTVIDCPSVVATHLSDVIKRNGFELLTRQEVRKIMDAVKNEYGAVVDELQKQNISMGDVQKVLQNLLKEGISIRNIVTILETISDHIGYTKNHDLITEKVRSRLGRQIIQQIAGDADKLYVVTLSPELENALAGSLQTTESGSGYEANIGFNITGSMLDELSAIITKIGYTVTPVVVANDTTRSVVKQIVVSKYPKIPVVSYTELSAAQVKVDHLGIIKGNFEEEPA